MTFDETLVQVMALLQRDGRVSYRALKRRFNLDDEYLDDLKTEIIKAKKLAVDEDGEILVWTGASLVSSSTFQVPGAEISTTPPLSQDSALRTQHSAAERRHLTVMFCDLIGSTALSARLDPEDYRTVVQTYHATCATVIEPYAGHIAQHLGDGLLVYFGYPVAHEDDARRAVRAGLEIIETLRQQVPSPLRGEGQGEGEIFSPLQGAPHPNPLPQGARELHVRIGIHTGLVVVGDIGVSGRTEQLALGETPNIAARMQGLAEPNTVLVSAATQRLIDGQFECQPFGSHLVKGIDTPLAVYHVQSERQNAFLLVGKAALTPLVGREQEVGLLIDRWEQVKEGRGQVVLLSGEPGIGKSRLAYTLKEHVTAEGSLLFESRCSPYYQHSALYPLIDVVQRTLLLTRQEPDAEKIAKLERALALYGMQETLPLFTALLSLPTPPQYPSPNFTPQKQKEHTLQAMMQLLVAQAERQATVVVWEDLHWADPSSLEFLTLLVEQIPTSRLLLVLTFRPEFTLPWKPRSHITQLTLNRLGQKQVESMIEKVAERQDLPSDIIQQICIKTDGVPLFVEELTKSVVETVGATHASPLLPLNIPATLQEALMARLDRLSSARQIAQLGATLGREFSYELLHAVAPVAEADLQAALVKLVEAEILYQRGVGGQTRYFFKHALIQDTAYQSLLKSTRQQYHQQIVRVLEERFPDTKANQPELLAHHYTEAGLVEQAILYWQAAGQKAVERSANAEAVSHLTQGLELLQSLPDTAGRAQRELTLQLALGTPLMATQGEGAREVESVYTRALELCRQVGETPQLFPAMAGLWLVHTIRGELQAGRELAEQLLRFAQNAQDPALLLSAHLNSGISLYWLGEFAAAHAHVEQGLVLYDPQQYRSQAFPAGLDPGVLSLSYKSWILWFLGYPDQALKQSDEALTLVKDMSRPYDVAVASSCAVFLYQLRREAKLTQERAEALIAFSTEQGFPLRLAQGIYKRGWALAEQGQVEEGIAEMQQGEAAYWATGTAVGRPEVLAWLAKAYGKMEQVEEGLSVLAEALALVEKTGERVSEAELYRLKGELLLAQADKLRE